MPWRFALTALLFTAVNLSLAWQQWLIGRAVHDVELGKAVPRGLRHLRQLLLNFKAHVDEREYALPNGHGAFDAHGNLISEQDQARLHQLIADFIRDVRERTAVAA